jgi:hypothetical protein
MVSGGSQGGGWNHQRAEQPIASRPGLRGAAGPQRPAHPALGAIGEMQGEVAPPRAMVVPQVMIGILRTGAERELDRRDGRDWRVHTVPGIGWM